MQQRFLNLFWDFLHSMGEADYARYDLLFWGKRPGNSPDGLLKPSRCAVFIAQTWIQSN